MAQKGFQLDQDTFSCPICLDLLNDPVALPCGHSYCMNCIKDFWREEVEGKIYSCPQCRQAFTSRPALVKNTMLAVLVEGLKKTGHQAAPADHCYAGPDDVACDYCTGRKLKAHKSCLFCLASYCEQHLQPHYQSPTFEKHKLTEPCKKLQENICSHHDEVMKIFCRTDKQSICDLCSMDEHKGHDTVSSAAERTEKQREVAVSRQNIQQRIQDREKDVRGLQQEVEEITRSADEAVKGSEKVFSELIGLMEKRSSEVKQQIRYQQKTEISRVKELQEKLEKEITELKRRDDELGQLARIEDHNQFLCVLSLSQISEPANLSRIPSSRRPQRYFNMLTDAVAQVEHRVKAALSKKVPDMSPTVREEDVSPSQPEPKTRDEFLQYSRKITLDPNTAHTHLLLSERNKTATLTPRKQQLRIHPDRFTGWFQALSRECLIRRCYWEVESAGFGVNFGVSYKNVSRAGRSDESHFGHNDKSWMMARDTQGSCTFYHNSVQIPVSAPQCSKTGVYLDHSAGILAFYSVSETMTLIHRVQTTFTQPLYVGLELFSFGDSARLCELTPKFDWPLFNTGLSRLNQVPSQTQRFFDFYGQQHETTEPFQSW